MDTDASKHAIVLCEEGAITEPLPRAWSVIIMPRMDLLAVIHVLKATYKMGVKQGQKSK